MLALAQEPGFDANEYSSAYASSPDSVRSTAVTDTYEPGSTFKVVTVAGAIEDFAGFRPRSRCSGLQEALQRGRVGRELFAPLLRRSGHSRESNSRAGGV